MDKTSREIAESSIGMTLLQQMTKSHYIDKGVITKFEYDEDTNPPTERIVAQCDDEYCCVNLNHCKSFCIENHYATLHPHKEEPHFVVALNDKEEE